MPTGGNVDHIAIGPGGVIVADAKAWTGEVVVRDGLLRASGRRQDKALDGVLAQVAAVKAAVGESVTVVPALVLTERPTSGLERLNGVGIIGIAELAAVDRELPAECSTVEVERIFRVLSEAFAPGGAAPATAMGMVEVETNDTPRDLFLKAHRWVYLNTWKNRRIYARSDRGEELGWKDVLTGELHIDGDHPFVHVVLGAATPAGTQLGASQIPKIPIDVRGGRLLGALTRIYMGVFIGQRWEKGGKRRLYGTLATPSDGVFRLGWVDLETGFVRPETTGPLCDGRRPAEYYLGMLRDRMPER